MNGMVCAMTNPDKCYNCPVQSNARNELEAASAAYALAFEKCMGDTPEYEAKHEFLIAQHYPEDTDCAYDSLEEITEEIRATYAADMDKAENEINDLKQQMGKYAANCDGVVRMSVTLADGRTLQAIVCGSREPGTDSHVLEPADIQRSTDHRV